MDGLAPTVRRRIQQILGRMADGNLGDVRAVGEGVIERRADFGPGYRIYSAWDGPDLIILLAGGDKSAQRDDIPRARERGETTERGKREEATMPLSEDWKIAERRAIKRDPELHAETVKGIRELLATDDDEDRRVAYHLARGLLELEFDTDAELLAQLRESIPALNQINQHQAQGGKIMRVVRIANVEHVPLGTAEAVPGWTGGDVHRTRQPIIPEGESDFFNASVVNFEKGAQTGWHVHSSDQILVITVGNGIVANETEEHHVGVGDVVQIKAGENHWHGATANGYMGHITITSSDSTASR